jgi:hypothetical protein
VRFDGLAMDGMRTDGWTASKDVDALVGDVDAAGEGVEDDAAGAVAYAQPGDLRGAQHPGGGVGGVVNLVEVVGSGDVEIGGLGVELLADTVTRGDGAVSGDAKVFVVLEEDLLIVTGDEIAGDDGSDAGAGRPLDEVVDEGRGKLAEAEGVFLDLLREEIEGRGWFAVGRSEVEAAQGDAGLEVYPEKAATLEVRSLLAGDEEIAIVAELDRDAGAVESHREGVGQTHVPAVVEDAARDKELH